MDKKIIFLTAVLFVCWCSAAPPVSEDDKKYIATILEKVPELERKQFLAHQLYKGYILNHPDDIAYNVSQETTQKLYDLFLTNYVITPSNGAEVFDQLCFPSGECVDTDDPGVYP